MNKLNYRKTLLLGFGFFSISVMWAVYNSFMPLILKRFIGSATLIGFIMTIDNYLALFIQPAVGSISDRINTRFGRRMPFIMVGMPIAAILLVFLGNYGGLISLITFLVLTNLSMSIFRSPVISLMPDITPKEHRSRANGIINLMGGIGAVIAYFIGSKLWDMSEKAPFYMSAALMVVSFIVLFSFIKEKRDALEIREEETEDFKIKLTQSPGEIRNDFSEGRARNVVLLLLAICSWFIAYQGIEAFFSLYGTEFLGLKESDATMSFTFISLSFLVFAVPAGYVGTRFGKRRTILFGVVGLMATFGIIIFLRNIFFIRIVFIFSGFFWSMININSYPFVTDMAPKGRVGTFTGLYYLASSIAAIVSPLVLGGIIDIIGYKYVFVYGTVFTALALVFMLMIGREKKMLQ